MKLQLLSLVAVWGLGIFAAEAKTLVNVDKKGVGLQGYDPVGFFTEGQPVRGKPELQSTYQGVLYFFASAENKEAFEKEPAKYEPQFGGYCAYGVSRGKAAPVKVDAFQIVNGRLLLQYDKSVRDLFNEDTQGNLKLADEKWPQVIERHGK